jgi:hypothetical protein
VKQWIFFLVDTFGASSGKNVENSKNVLKVSKVGGAFGLFSWSSSFLLDICEQLRK